MNAPIVFGPPLSFGDFFNYPGYAGYHAFADVWISEHRITIQLVPGVDPAIVRNGLCYVWIVDWSGRRLVTGTVFPHNPQAPRARPAGCHCGRHDCCLLRRENENNGQDQ